VQNKDLDMPSLPSADQLFAAMDATWPPRATQSCGPFTLRDGAGGGKRVSAATCATGQASLAEVETAAAAMHAAGDEMLFGLRGDQSKLDQTLETAGYSIIDPVVIYAKPAADLAALAPDGLTAIFADSPLNIQAELWAAGGIGPARLDVMRRAKGPKTHILARHNDRPAGVAYVAIHGNIAMLHALEVVPAFRRQGVGATTTANAAKWAMSNGAQFFSLVTTVENVASNALYSRMGMEVCARYHYRVLNVRR
jgi:GNAT superfamily N-acetyltransferase